ncbi:MAG: hypothetical protein QME82_02005 [Bacillota bacterium]|nr:hypothetical protein [Bacillota bacterium]
MGDEAYTWYSIAVCASTNVSMAVETSMNTVRSITMSLGIGPGERCAGDHR